MEKGIKEKFLLLLDKMISNLQSEDPIIVKSDKFNLSMTVDDLKSIDANEAALIYAFAGNESSHTLLSRGIPLINLDTNTLGTEISPFKLHGKKIPAKQLYRLLLLKEVVEKYGVEETLRFTAMGLPQMMGFNHQLMGYDSALDMFLHFIVYPTTQIDAAHTFLKKRTKKALEDAKKGDFVQIVHEYWGIKKDDPRIFTYIAKLRKNLTNFKNLNN